MFPLLILLNATLIAFILYIYNMVFRGRKYKDNGVKKIYSLKTFILKNKKITVTNIFIFILVGIYIFVFLYIRTLNFVYKIGFKMRNINYTWNS